MEINKEKAVQTFKSSLPLLYLVIALLALRWTIVEPYVVPTPSMEPTLKPGDRLYALKCAYDIRIPFTSITLLKVSSVKRGDVILFKFPDDPEFTYVKRAVAVAGDKVEYRNGELWINGERMNKSEPPDGREIMNDIKDKNNKTLYIENLTGVKHYAVLDNMIPQNRDMAERAIPEGYVFASGDNRDHSYDSRSWGLVPLQNLKGEAMFIWFSSWDYRIRWERIGTLIH